MPKTIEMTEAEFERQVKQLAATFGYSYYHTWRSIHSPAGFPDCVLAKPGRLIFAELKSEKGKMSDAQNEWIDVLYQAGAETYIWRPGDWEKIVKTLQGEKQGSRRKSENDIR